MRGEFHGVRAYICAKYNLVLYVHWASHFHNLVILDVCGLSQIWNYMPILNKIYNFFNAKTQNVLNIEIGKINYDTSKHKLNQFYVVRLKTLTFLKLR